LSSFIEYYFVPLHPRYISIFFFFNSIEYSSTLHSKSFGLDYVKHNVVKDQDGQWFVVFGYYENFYALKLATGAVHFWDSEGNRFLSCKLITTAPQHNTTPSPRNSFFVHP